MSVEILVHEDKVDLIRVELNKTAGVRGVIGKNKNYPQHITLMYTCPGRELWVWDRALELGASALIH